MADLLGVTCDNPTSNECTITCNANDCYSKIISCPDSGCNIKCKEKNSCVKSQVFYTGALTDSATVSIECTAEFACDEMTVNANNANKIDYTCTSKSNDVTIWGTYANEVNINCRNTESCYEQTFNVNDAKKATLNARGHQAFYKSTVSAIRTGTVTLNCASDDYWYNACDNFDWYIPYNATINCFGDGCGYGDIYASYITRKLEQVTLNVNGCNQCDSVDLCTSSFYIKCGSNYGTSETFYGDTCSGSGDCDCNALKRNTNYYNDGSHSMCYGDSSSDAERIGMIVGIVIAAFCCLCCIAPAICIWLGQRNKKKYNSTVTTTTVATREEKPTGFFAIFYVTNNAPQQETEQPQEMAITQMEDEEGPTAQGALPPEYEAAIAAGKKDKNAYTNY